MSLSNTNYLTTRKNKEYLELIHKPNQDTKSTIIPPLAHSPRDGMPNVQLVQQLKLDIHLTYELSSLLFSPYQITHPLAFHTHAASTTHSRDPKSVSLTESQLLLKRFIRYTIIQTANSFYKVLAAHSKKASRPGEPLRRTETIVKATTTSPHHPLAPRSPHPLFSPYSITIVLYLRNFLVHPLPSFH